MKPIRRRLFTFGLLLSILQIPRPLLATIRPPQTPTKLGQKVIFRERIFTAVWQKSGGKKKLTWDTGIPIPAQPSPTPTQTPSPSPSPSSVSTPKTYEKIDIVAGESSSLANNGTIFIQAKNRYGNTSGYFIHRNGNILKAFSDICSHKGCSVEIAKEGFLCPCHNALFEAGTGKVLRGPASHPLDEIPVREENGKIIIKD